jgi:carboxymethylenebutenolidase
MPHSQASPSPPGVPGAVLDLSGICDEELTFAGFGGTQINGYLARPDDSELHPGLIVIHEAGGLSDHIRDVTRRFANQGYVALGVDLYTREGGPPPTGDLPAIMQRLFSMSDEVVLGDLNGAEQMLRSRQELSGKIGCIGFCMGGRLTLLFACSSDALDAAVDCWGGFVDRATLDERTTERRPTPPLEMLENLNCPLMAAFGAEDHNPSVEIAEQLRASLQSVPHESHVEVFQNASHAFFADYRPTYRPQAAGELWQRVLPFLAKHLKSGGERR